MIEGAGPPWRDTRAMAVLGTGHVLPGTALTTAALLDACLSDASHAATRRRAAAMARQINIQHRHIVRSLATRFEMPRAGMSNPELAAAAIDAALIQAGATVADISYLIGHTATPATPIPANIAWVADRLGYSGPTAEFRQACTGFANALVFSQGLAPTSGVIVIVGSETGSVFFDIARMFEDEGQLLNFVQMGDSAGAIVLRPYAGKGAHIVSSFFGSSGLGRAPGFGMVNGGSNNSHVGGVMEFAHDFDAVRAHGVKLFEHGLAASGMAATDCRWIIPHQANGRIDTLLAPILGVDSGRIFNVAKDIGNTGSAAIWTAFSMLRDSGLAAGDAVLTLGAEATKFHYGGFHYVHG
jgi:3-oxoacyl-[acyl-carrier-protein] synthase III